MQMHQVTQQTKQFAVDRNTYTISYNSNKPGASANIAGTTANSSHTYDTAKALTTNGYSISGWSFAGWNTLANGTGDNYTNSQSVTNLSSTQGATVTLYAKWAVNTYIMSYNYASGAAGTTNPTAWTYDASQFVSAPTRTGYTFNGWYLTGDNPNYSTAKYGSTSSPATVIANGTTKAWGGSAGANTHFINLSSTASGAVTLTAQWIVNTYTISYEVEDYSQTEPVRYIRNYILNGSNSNPSNHWVEIMAFDADNINVATPSNNANSIAYAGDNPSLLAPNLIDENLNSAQWGDPNMSNGTYKTVDLGSVFNISVVKVWHYHVGGRLYYDVRTEISVDGINWKEVHNTIQQGLYRETATGHIINLGTRTSYAIKPPEQIVDYNSTVNLRNNSYQWTVDQTYGNVFYGVVVGQPYTLNYFSRKGYTFVGWRSSYDNNIYSESQAFMMPNEDVVMTAEWSFEASLTITTTFDSTVESGMMAFIKIVAIQDSNYSIWVYPLENGSIYEITFDEMVSIVITFINPTNHGSTSDGSPSFDIDQTESSTVLNITVSKTTKGYIYNSYYVN